MIAAILTLTIERGATFELPLQLKDSKGEVYDLDDYTAEIRILGERKDYFVGTTEDGTIFIDSENYIRIVISDEKTNLMTSSVGVFDLDLFSPSGQVYRVARGNVKINAAVQAPTITTARILPRGV